MTYIHSFNHIHPSPFAEVPLHIFIAGKLSGKNLPVVPSRESNIVPIIAIGFVATSINNTSGTVAKFTAGVVETSGKFATGVVDTSGAP
jgi:hypothetical protein